MPACSTLAGYESFENLIWKAHIIQHRYAFGPLAMSRIPYAVQEKATTFQFTKAAGFSLTEPS